MEESIMKTRRAMFFIVMAAAVVFTVATAWSAEKKNTAQDHFNTIVTSYLKIQSSLAADKTDGVAAQAGVIIKAAADAGKLCKDKKGAALLASIKTQAKALTAKDIDLDAARDAFKPLSESVTRLAKTQLSAKESAKYNVFYCDMTETHWLQTTGKARNPFFGSKMLSCGSKLTDAEYKKHLDLAPNKMKGHGMSSDDMDMDHCGRHDH
jgi:hypothetical protein